MEIITEKQDGILIIEFNRPEKKNSITSAMYQMLADAVRDGESDKSVRVLLFRGKPDIFTAGNDIEDFINTTEDIEGRPVTQFIRNLSLAAKPVIAAVAGTAVGIGTTMLLHCDLIYAADNAKFSLPFVKLGLCPEFASTRLMPQIVGYQRAAELLLLGEPFSAIDAFNMGLVNKVLPSADLLSYTYAQAAKLVALPPSSLRITKSLMKARDNDAVTAQIREEIKHLRIMFEAPEAKEAFAAFFERRSPDYSKFS
ncbi:Enoyl-CoA hydratase/carnithine racemase [Syntrophus gentianae]|uniref:Enoyl-CoA hydratase/carnithine racemase n=1 Tax=Syntrophus gentianae TaxID=43775 RepID=A0A1H7WET3_9BACT|nr:enoyl-CoA hydratase [Syntrophus gentianae]SEM19990.1 Enoyl-CoA hydratase/carnithine racemase [Syntrophus gentianae]